MLRVALTMLRAVTRSIRDISRTVLLIGFADRLFRDTDGALFLVETERYSMRPPKRVRRIPDRKVLDQLVDETYWSNAGTLLAVIMVMLVMLVWGVLPERSKLSFSFSR
jgi:hypothetical protein